MSKIKSALIIPDTHVKHGPGGLDQKAFSALLKYAKTKKWDEVVHLGDVADYNCISRFDKGKLRGIESGAITKDNQCVNTFLDLLQGAVGKAKITLLEGNHDFRIETYLDFNPELEGQLECETAWRLKERGINWVRFWRDGDVYKIGKALFIHGDSLIKCHAERNCRDYGGNVFYGHTHDIQCFPVQEHNKLPKVGQSLGCLQARPKWTRGKPLKWQQAFGVFYFLPNGEFAYNVVRIMNGRFISPEGKEFVG